MRFFVLLLTVLLAGPAFAQSDAAPATNTPAFTQPELDQMLAPVALYPDPLLTEVLTAATYPLEIVEAARWSQANPELTGTDAVDAASAENWDQNVKALLAFPDLLQMMSDQIDWTQRLGDAFLEQQGQVMDTVQNLRQRAEAAGTLRSEGEISVNDDNGYIDIEPAAPDLVYLPYYDPTVVYGTWWWPAYPPVCWAAWPGYGWQGAFAWGGGVLIGAGFFRNDFNWRHHRIDVRDHGRSWHGSGAFARGHEPSHGWTHDSAHRRGVAYQNPELQRHFDNGRAVARGHGGDATRALLEAQARMPRNYAHRELPRTYMAPRLQRNYAAPTFQRGFAAPRAQTRYQSGGRMMPAQRSAGRGGHSGMRMAPARGGGSSPHGR